MSEEDRSGEPAEARGRLSPAEQRFERRRRTAGLFLGPAAFAALLAFPPSGLAPPAARLAAILAWVVTWWVTGAVPIPVTSLLGPALAAICGVGPASKMFAGFGDPILFLFLGSFVLAEGLFATGLDRRLAYAILSRRWVGSSTTRLLGAFVLITGGLSMWLSNTATTAMMYPIAMSVLAALGRLLARDADGPVDVTRLRFGTGLMLAAAYASSIGGIATPVGSPPNLIALGQLAGAGGVRLSFFQWTLIAAPVMLVMLGVLLAYLRWALPPEVRRIEGSRELILRERAALGPLGRAEWNVVVAFGVTVSLWVLPGVVALAAGTSSVLTKTVQAALPESAVALCGAALLFVLPVSWRERRFTLTWSRAVRIDWGTLLLFGGGLSLGGAMLDSGLADAIGTTLIDWTGARSLPALTWLFAFVSLLLTETTSNTAAATMICPLAVAAAHAAGVSPVAPTIAAGLGAGMAFMLPVSTPPNAIVYGSGCVPITAMLRHGFVLDLAALVVVPAGTLLLCRALGF
jgi:sodium-dependent dicarboxylate transporter 2/3/5